MFNINGNFLSQNLQQSYQFYQQQNFVVNNILNMYVQPQPQIVSYNSYSAYNTQMSTQIMQQMMGFATNMMIMQMMGSMFKSMLNAGSSSNEPDSGNNIFTNLINLILKGLTPEPEPINEVYLLGSYNGDNLGKFVNAYANNGNENDETLKELYDYLNDNGNESLEIGKREILIVNKIGEVIGTIPYSELASLGKLNVGTGHGSKVEGTGGTITFEGVEYDVLASVIKHSPIILDLDDDGIELSSQKDGVNFDLDGDGKIDKTSWTAGGKDFDDAFLVLDRDGNGKIDSGKELFGDQHGEENGYFELAKYDLNKDSKIDANDDVYTKLELWSDMNHNGQVDEGELKTLAEMGVKSISTGFNTEFDESGKIKEDEYGNIIGITSTFEREDGSIGKSMDAFFVLG